MIIHLIKMLDKIKKKLIYFFHAIGTHNVFLTNNRGNKIHLFIYGRLFRCVSTISCGSPQEILIYTYQQIYIYF